ncbi:MAG: DUF86 domain-containing protein [Magnetococcales bacterium]|nr:DUF86 domain-containing protein [Magnetococcales bacterium]
MGPEDRLRVRHVLDAASEAVRFCAGRTQLDIETDRMLLLAVVRCIEIIGEAAGEVSLEFRAVTPEIPWRNMVAMRNRLIHGYFDVDPVIVWKTVTVELPGLIRRLGILME